MTAEVHGPSHLLCYKESGQAAGLCNCLQLAGWIAKGYVERPFNWASRSPRAPESEASKEGHQQAQANWMKGQQGKQAAAGHIRCIGDDS